MPGGLRQRVAIARAFVGDPPILVLDEPSSNLDREGEQELAETLKAHAGAGHTMVVVTHSAGVLMASDQVVVMQKGRVVRAGRPEDILPQLVAGAPGAQARSVRTPARAVGAGAGTPPQRPAAPEQPAAPISPPASPPVSQPVSQPAPRQPAPQAAPGDAGQDPIGEPAIEQQPGRRQQA